MVRSLLTIADYRILSTPKAPQAAWERLREDLVRPVVRHRLEAELLLVRNFVEDIEWVEPSAGGGAGRRGGLGHLRPPAGGTSTRQPAAAPGDPQW